MNVLDLMASITLDTSGYEQKITDVAKLTEAAASRMSTAAGATEEIEGGAEAASVSVSAMGTAEKKTAEAAEAMAKEHENAGKAIDDSKESTEEYRKEAEKASKTTDDFGEQIDRLVKRAAAMVGIGKIFKDTIDQGAALQQSIGGVETLFKDSADIVIANAQRAYQTAGMDANTYMETVTGFSASLLQSLGNDTEKAAELSNQAIIDMSDNANKMGTDISSIMVAYQGFAKQNFTMLDNLKIGYGGTKSEMERLLADAEKLQAAQGNIVEYSIDSYADIVEAIHVVQTNIGITGTTALEAEKTFTGSFSAMSAAAKNLMGDLSSGAGDVNADVQALTKTTVTFVGGNLLPFLGNIVTGLNDIDGVLGGVIKVVEAGAVYMAAGKLEGALSSLLGIQATEAISLDVLKVKVQETSAAISSNPLLIYVTATTAAASALKRAIDDATKSIDAAAGGYDQLTEAQKKSVDEINTVLEAIQSSRTERGKELQDLEVTSAEYRTLTDRLYDLDSAEKLDNSTKSEMSAIVEELNSQVEGLNIELDKETGHIINSRTEIDRKIESLQNEAKAEAAREQLVEIYKQQTDAEQALTKATEERESARKRIAEIEDEWARLSDQYIEKYGEYSQVHHAETDTLKALEDEYNNLVDSMGELDAAYVYASQTVRDLGNDADEVSDTIIQAMGAAATATTNYADSFYRYNDEIFAVSKSTIEKIGEINAEYENVFEQTKDRLFGSLDWFKEYENKSAGTFEDMVNVLDSNINAFSDWADGLQELADRGVNQGLIDTLQEAGPQSAQQVRALTSATDPELQEYSKKWEEAYALVEEAARTQTKSAREETEAQVEELLKNADNFYMPAALKGSNIGRYFADGIEDGFIGELPRISTHINNQADYYLIQAMEERFKIESPSKLTRDLIGKNLAAGIGVGFEDEMEKVSADMDDLVPDVITSLEPNVTSQTQITGAPVFGQMLTLLSELLAAVREGKQIYLDGDALVGATADAYDAAMGQKIAMAEGGLV